MGYKRQAGRAPQSFHPPAMERQATQPAAVPSGRKRRRVSPSKKQKEETQAAALDLNASQPPTSELVLALSAIPRADPPPTPSPTISPDPSVMEGTLKEYEEECLEEGTVQADPIQEDYVLDQMDTQLNELLYETCPFHPGEYLQCVNPQTQFGQLRFKCPHEGCPVYLFEDNREVMMETLKEDTHPQVRARLQRGELKCKCGFVPRMKLSRTSKNFQKVFFSCGSFLPGHDPCGYFQWLHGPLWCPRDPTQPTLRRWVRDTPPAIHYKEYPPKFQPWGYPAVPLLKGRHPDKELVEQHWPWAKQFGEMAQAKERARERARHQPKNFGSSVLF